MLATCPICNFKESETVLTFERAPIFQLVKGVEEVTSDSFARLEIVRCQACGHLYNRAYSQEVGERMYRGDVLSNVPVHISMSKNLERIANWIGLPQYASKRVIEIGAGSGHLSRILAQAAKSVVVFEPSRGLRADMLPEANITLVNEPFSASKAGEVADLIVCRQVLEHVADPLKFLCEIRASLAEGGSLYLEVPCTEYIDEKAVVIDFHYPHVHYFYKQNLFELAESAGLVPERDWLLMNGHDFGVLLRPQATKFPVKSTEKLPIFSNLAVSLERQLLQGHNFLRELSGNVALYGASWHGVAFLNAFQSSRKFACAFDDNTDYIARNLYSFQQVVPVLSSALEHLQKAEAIIITAYLHQDAIIERLRQKGFTGKIISPFPEFTEVKE